MSNIVGHIDSKIRRFDLVENILPGVLEKASETPEDIVDQLLPFIIQALDARGVTRVSDLDFSDLEDLLTLTDEVLLGLIETGATDK